ncbi:histidinol-phosphate transaminase [Kineococcus sp. SYSU DK003]|uniref:histidinol-phosphate transaminase n=1 Tax=Kineococcus sp. SYSU DK003 TaxID=3383124 RepID=UPI003D7D0BCB
MSAPTLLRPRATVAALPAYVAGRRAPATAGLPLTAALAANESHHPPLPAVLEVVRAQAADLNRYPDPASTQLRERLGDHLGVGADEIAVGPGSVGVLAQVLAAVCDAGDEVVFAWRSFEAYPILTTLAGAVPVPVPLRDDERHDLTAMAAAVTDRTRAVLLCSPNNPTGVAIGKGEFERFLAAVPAHVLVVVDEAYLEYAHGQGPDALAWHRRVGNLCVLRTFSKAHGLAGLRVGYAVTNPDLAEGLRRVGLPFAVSALAQRAAVASLDAVDQMRERVAGTTAERARVTAVLRGAGWTVPDSAANFVWLRTDDVRRAELLAAFDAAGVLVRGYPGDGIRITLADPATNDRVLDVLAAGAHRW